LLILSLLITIVMPSILYCGIVQQRASSVAFCWPKTVLFALQLICRIINQNLLNAYAYRL